MVDKKQDKLPEVRNIEGHVEEELYIVVLSEHMLWLAVWHFHNALSAVLLRHIFRF